MKWVLIILKFVAAFAGLLVSCYVSFGLVSGASIAMLVPVFGASIAILMGLYRIVFFRNSNANVMQDRMIWLSIIALFTIITFWAGKETYFFPLIVPLITLLSIMTIYYIICIKVRIRLVAVIFLLYLACGFGYAQYTYTNSKIKFNENDKYVLNDISLTDMDGDIIRAVSTNKPSVLLYTAIDCVPCAQLLPVYYSISNEMCKKANFVLINAEDSISRIKDHYKSHPACVMLAADGRLSQFKSTLEQPGYPQLFVVAKSGKIIFHFGGYNPSYKNNIIHDLQEAVIAAEKSGGT